MTFTSVCAYLCLLVICCLFEFVTLFVFSWFNGLLRILFCGLFIRLLFFCGLFIVGLCGLLFVVFGGVDCCLVSAVFWLMVFGWLFVSLLFCLWVLLDVPWCA